MKLAQLQIPEKHLAEFKHAYAIFLGQYQRARAEGMVFAFQQSSLTYGEHGLTLPLGLGHGSRETNFRDIKGDFRDGVYHGYGVMQVDINTDPEFCRRWRPGHAPVGILRGCAIWDDKYREIAASEGKRLAVKGHPFTVPAVLEADDIRRIAVAAYNNGRWPLYCFSLGNHVDSFTTNKNYSRDVYDRAFYFACVLGELEIEPDAVQQELDLQGKYARDWHQTAAGIVASGDGPELMPLEADAPGKVESVIEKQKEVISVVTTGEPVTPAPVVTVQPVAPEAVATEETPQPMPRWLTIFNHLKHWLVVAPASSILGYIGYLKSVDHSLLITVIVAIAGAVLGYVGVSSFYRNKKEQRDHDATMQREQRAHELTKLQIESASRLDRTTVQLGGRT